MGSFKWGVANFFSRTVHFLVELKELKQDGNIVKYFDILTY